ncbi:MAG: hypothetical protein AB7P01_09035 [Bacteroidia bacterium]
MDTTLSIIVAVVNVVLVYFLRNNLLDLISRLFQNLNRPLDYLTAFLTGSISSVIRLTYRQQVLNFFIVVIAVVLVFSEFSTLNEVVKGVSADNLEGINLGFAKVPWSVFSAISYIAIATLLGFIALELISFRELLQGILFNDPPVISSGRVSQKLKHIIAIILFIGLLALAFLQGDLAIYRLDELSSELKTDAVKNHTTYIKAFYFALGFLTPIVAAIAFISLDIFISILVGFLIAFIIVLQKILSAIYYAIEIIIFLTSSPIDKLLELFGIFQADKITELNMDIAKPAKKLAPLGNTSDIYLQNQAEIYDNFNRDLMLRRKIIFVCDNPKFKIAYPSSELPFDNDTKFQEVKDLIITKFPILQDKDLKFSFIDINGLLITLDLNQHIADYLRQTNSVFIQLATMETPSETIVDDEKNSR